VPGCWPVDSVDHVDKLREHARWLGGFQVVGWRAGVLLESRKILALLARRDGVRPPRLLLIDGPHPPGMLAEIIEGRRTSTIRVWMRDRNGALLSPSEIFDSLVHEADHHDRFRKRRYSGHNARFYRRVAAKVQAVGQVDPLLRLLGFVGPIVTEALLDRWGIGPRRAP